MFLAGLTLGFPHSQYALPMPKGGRHNNIILREDQSEYLRARPKVRCSCERPSLYLVAIERPWMISMCRFEADRV